MQQKFEKIRDLLVREKWDEIIYSVKLCNRSLKRYEIY